MTTTLPVKVENASASTVKVFTETDLRAKMCENMFKNFQLYCSVDRRFQEQKRSMLALDYKKGLITVVNEDRVITIQHNEYGVECGSVTDFTMASDTRTQLSKPTTYSVIDYEDYFGKGPCFTGGRWVTPEPKKALYHYYEHANGTWYARCKMLLKNFVRRKLGVSYPHIRDFEGKWSDSPVPRSYMIDAKEAGLL